MACLPKSDEKIKLAILYKAKIYRKKIISGMKVRDSSHCILDSAIINQSMDPCSAEKFQIRLFDVMLKVLLPAFFIALKLTGTFIDFMLGLSNSEKKNEDFKSMKIKNLLGSEIVDSFNFRTCVNPKLTKLDSGETKIIYQSLTAQDLCQKS